MRDFFSGVLSGLNFSTWCVTAILRQVSSSFSLSRRRARETEASPLPISDLGDTFIEKFLR